MLLAIEGFSATQRILIPGVSEVCGLLEVDNVGARVESVRVAARRSRRDMRIAGRDCCWPWATRSGISVL